MTQRFFQSAALGILLTLGLFAFTQASDIDGDYTNEFVATIRGGDGELKEVLTHLEKRSAVRVIDTVSIWIFYGYYSVGFYQTCSQCGPLACLITTVLYTSISSPPLQEDEVIPHRVRVGNYSTLYSKQFYSKQSKLDGRGWKQGIQVRDYSKLKPVLLANLWSNVCSIQMQWTVAYFVESKIG